MRNFSAILIFHLICGNCLLAFALPRSGSSAEREENQLENDQKRMGVERGDSGRRLYEVIRDYEGAGANRRHDPPPPHFEVIQDYEGPGANRRHDPPPPHFEVIQDYEGPGANRRHDPPPPRMK